MVLCAGNDHEYCKSYRGFCDAPFDLSTGSIKKTHIISTSCGNVHYVTLQAHCVFMLSALRLRLQELIKVSEKNAKRNTTSAAALLLPAGCKQQASARIPEQHRQSQPCPLDAGGMSERHHFTMFSSVFADLKSDHECMQAGWLVTAMSMLQNVRCRRARGGDWASGA